MSNGEINRLHDQAMDACERGLALLREAARDELAAADLLAERKDCEPTRSVIHRSAAWLLFRTEQYNEAIKVALRGMNGDPPGEIERELQEVLGWAIMGQRMKEGA